MGIVKRGEEMVTSTVLTQWAAGCSRVLGETQLYSNAYKKRQQSSRWARKKILNSSHLLILGTTTASWHPGLSPSHSLRYASQPHLTASNVHTERKLWTESTWWAELSQTLKTKQWVPKNYTQQYKFLYYSSKLVMPSLLKTSLKKRIPVPLLL